MKLGYLLRGLPGHPLHPPLTDATIGIYTFATVAALADVLGISDHAATQGWWLALLAGLITTMATSLTGLIDWLGITRGTELWKTATAHMVAMLIASVFFLLALLVGHDDFKAGDVTTGPLLLTLVGFGLLTLGGWLGGTVVFVHGMRVLNLVDEPTERAVSPVPKPEQEQAEA
ncbi:MAG: DUF2231 domain-containing protein [Actinobacteria bacterium]|nr:DUF2231 domain-containing protein [Actinomycetota bacterium]